MLGLHEILLLVLVAICLLIVFNDASCKCGDNCKGNDEGDRNETYGSTSFSLTGERKIGQRSANLNLSKSNLRSANLNTSRSNRTILNTSIPNRTILNTSRSNRSTGQLNRSPDRNIDRHTDTQYGAWQQGQNGLSDDRSNIDPYDYNLDGQKLQADSTDQRLRDSYKLKSSGLGFDASANAKTSNLNLSKSNIN